MGLKARRTSASQARAVDALESAGLRGASSVAAFVVSSAGDVVAANRCLVALLGGQSESDLIGLALSDLVAGRREWPAWYRSSTAGHERGVRLRFRGSSGDVLLKGDLAPLDGGDLLIGLFADVTEEQSLRDAVQRGARMEALGSLTSGIAHDFNNLLTVLVGNLYLVAEELRGETQIFSKLKAARDAAKRGADLIRQLLAFAKRESIEPEVVDPAKVAENLVPLLRRALGPKATLEIRFAPGAGRVHCNAGQLESVLVNLAVNARDAMLESGRIVIVGDNVQISSAEAERRGVAAGGYLRLSVTDDGSGIAPETLERIFEPFFTTKADRGGTGLGLSMVRWFAQQSGGAVEARSIQSKGTTISLLLPLAAEQNADTVTRTTPLMTLPSGEERVLVFAADESLRATIKQTLEVLGYTVHVGADAAAALDVLRTTPVDLLLADTAAQLDDSRQALLRDALTARPSLKVIFTADAAHARRTRPSGGATSLLGKPFSIADLACAVRGALDGDLAG